MRRLLEQLPWPQSTKDGVLDPRFEDLTAQREAVMDALAPPGSIGWLRNQARGIRYKPGWKFEIFGPDPGNPFVAQFFLTVTVVDPNRRLQMPEIASSLPPGHEGNVLTLRGSLMPFTQMVDEFRSQARHVINGMEQEITDRWLRYE